LTSQLKLIKPTFLQIWILEIACTWVGLTFPTTVMTQHLTATTGHWIRPSILQTLPVLRHNNITTWPKKFSLVMDLVCLYSHRRFYRRGCQLTVQVFWFFISLLSMSLHHCLGVHLYPEFGKYQFGMHRSEKIYSKSAKAYTFTGFKCSLKSKYKVYI
jgi:hypothetical protein